MSEVGNLKLEIRNLWFSYEKTGSFLFQDVNFTLLPGEVALVVGKNGSGKSTFLKLIAGLIRPQNGRILLNGKEIHSSQEHFRKIGFVMQFAEDLFLCKTVEEEILYTSKNFRLGSYEDRLIKACKLAGIDEQLLVRSVFSLSHGEAKKVAVAAAIAHDPEVLLLDEPFVGLDKAGKMAIVNLLKNWQQLGKSAVLTAQNPRVLDGLNTTTYILKDGKLERIDMRNTAKSAKIDSGSPT